MRCLFFEIRLAKADSPLVQARLLQNAWPMAGYLGQALSPSLANLVENKGDKLGRRRAV